MNKKFRLLGLFLVLGFSGALFGAATSSIIYPIGQIATSAMDGGTWLQMNGQVVSQATYPSLFSIIGHQPEFTWTFSNVIGPGTAPYTWLQVAYGNNTYVLISSTAATDGTVYTSSDAVTWTSRTAVSSLQPAAVIYDSTNALFVEVGSGGLIGTSPDGITWTSRTSGTANALIGISRVGGFTVAFTNSGTLCWATDSVTYTATTPNVMPSIGGIVSNGNGSFLAAPSSGATLMINSTTGSTWNSITKPTTNGYNFLGVYSNSFYITDNTTGQIYSSPTGATWTLVGQPAYFSTNGAGYASIWLPNGLMSLISLTLNISSSGMYSTDGFNTTHFVRYAPVLGGLANPVSSPIGGQTAQNFILAYGVGPALYASADGKTYTVDPTSSGVPFAAQSNPFKICYANGRYFLFPAGYRILSAPEPYSPATQFQIPLNSPNGTPLYIKAL